MITQQPDAHIPLVSVIVPAYNAEKFIAKTLYSIIEQTYKNIEILVVDDGSQDKTAEIVRSIAQKYQQIILLQQSNSGVASARNLAIENSRGEFIAPIDADDIWYPQKIEKQVQCMLQAGSEVGLVYSWSMDIEENEMPTGYFRASRIEGDVYTTLLLHYFIGNASSIMIRRTCFEQVGGYDSGLKKQDAQGSEDWDICLRIAEYYQFRVVPEILVGYRQLPNSMSKDYSQMAKSHDLMWQSIRGKYPNMPTYIERLSASSFYMYLANQSNQGNNPRISLNWLYKALKADIITPCFRLSLYKLLLTSIFKLLTQRTTGSVVPIYQPQTQIQPIADINYQKNQPENFSDLYNFLNSEQQKLNKTMKVQVEIILHQLAPKIFGTPRQWKKQSF
ncbi:glycosyltransferase family 2 protein [Cylindrospermum sp. FACHB-282]|uniref:glycosyltransferase family 2 protein n=1 Tax=Cylindrospermum sp. FACHB-282 TaxID=2692794 RepID=UPI001685451C|nr:glycosyltransferase family A protein [Cylindrospermum sp. FACHB-282]MBD2387213.1 glycosyltransferase family 2 protein [Cylindrospermum sp. FACHB-282]